MHESSDSACIKGGVPNKDLKDAEKLAFYEKTALDVGVLSQDEIVIFEDAENITISS